MFLLGRCRPIIRPPVAGESRNPPRLTLPSRESQHWRRGCNPHDRALLGDHAPERQDVASLPRGGIARAVGDRSANRLPLLPDEPDPHRAGHPPVPRPRYAGARSPGGARNGRSARAECAHLVATSSVWKISWNKRAAVASMRRLLEPGLAPIAVEHRNVPTTTVAGISETVSRAEILDWYSEAVARADRGWRRRAPRRRPARRPVRQRALHRRCRQRSPVRSCRRATDLRTCAAVRRTGGRVGHHGASRRHDDIDVCTARSART